MSKQYFRKLKVHEQITKAMDLEDDEFKYSEIFDSKCFILGGFLSTNGEAPCLEKEAKMLGYSVDEHTRLFNQMLKHGLAERDKTGRAYSPSILDEIHISQVRSNAGKAGGGSPLLKQMNKQMNKQNVTLVSNSSSSTKDGESEGKESPSPFAADSEPVLLTNELCYALTNAGIRIQNSKKWPRTFDLMLRRDKREPQQIREVIGYLFSDMNDGEFAFVVHSATALREKFDRIVTAMSKATQGSKKDPIQALRDEARGR